MIRLAALSLVVVAAACTADDPPTSELAERAERAVYAHAPIGFSGAYTKEFELVIEGSQTAGAEQLYLDDLGSSDPATRLYGLLGLKIIGSDEYPTYLKKLRTDHTMAMFGMGGCTIWPEPVSFVADQIQKLPDGFKRPEAAAQ